MTCDAFAVLLLKTTDDETNNVTLVVPSLVSLERENEQQEEKRRLRFLFLSKKARPSGVTDEQNENMSLSLLLLSLSFFSYFDSTASVNICRRQIDGEKIKKVGTYVPSIPRVDVVQNRENFAPLK